MAHLIDGAIFLVILVALDRFYVLPLKRRHAKEAARLERSVYRAQRSEELALLEVAEARAELEEERLLVDLSPRSRLSA